MSYCVNPGCASPCHEKIVQYCQSCGATILLQNRYRPLHPIGQGGFGKTYLAVDEHLPSKPPCVIKQFQFQTENAESYHKAARLFKEEAVRLDDLGQHPQIPQLLAHFEQNQQLFLVQEYIPGKTLAQELAETGVFSETQIWQVLRGLLPVLQFIHEHQIVHRDIKPANIIRHSAAPMPLPSTIPIPPIPGKFSATQNTLKLAEMKTKILENVETTQIQEVVRDLFPPPPTLKLKTASDSKSPIVLIDFGVSKLLTGTALIRTGTVVGSPEFMAPEQTRGKAFPASDLYGLGVTCLYLLTGISPWNLYDVVRERWVWQDFLTSNPVDLHLATILNRLVAPQLNQRYHSAAEVLQALNKVLNTDTNIQQTQVQAQTQTPSQTSIQAQASKAFYGSHPQTTSETQPPASRLSIALSRWFPALGQPLNDKLISRAGVDYIPLQQMLATRRWQKADQETGTLLRQVLKKATSQYLHPQDLKDLPCEDLGTIDRLWLKYSNGRFGFSVQGQIYQKFEGDYGAFCQQVGWLTYNPLNPLQSFTFKLSAPVGHLPSRIWVQTGGKWWKHAEVMAEKLAECQII
ncbi:MAG: protein kinase [Oscillatoriales cyanobacterium RM2_1_1]|nr:protein kinase [Oscillatoriales cyanobacterium SM2_3_0]NJO45480.1 protein kinase [Oscillatoriales cyanobacterium RM2_1_1]